jgi:hypothetical protein
MNGRAVLTRCSRMSGEDEHGATLRAEGLRQGPGDDDVLGPGVARGRHEPAPAGPDDPQRVRLVDDQERADLGRQVDEVLDRSRVAEHRVDRLGDDDGARGVPAREQVGDVVEVVVPRDRHGRARQAAAVDEARVGVLVADDEGAGIREGGEGTARFAAYPVDSTRADGAPVSAVRAASSSSWMGRVPLTRRDAPAPPP